MDRAALFVLTLALFLYENAASFRQTEGDDQLSHTNDHLERLATAFDKLVDEKVDEVCDEVVNMSKGWIEDLDRESVREVAADCNRVTGVCGMGCDTGRGKCRNGYCDCDEGECSVDVDGKKYRQCASLETVVTGLKNGSIDKDDLEPENGFARAVDAVAGLPQGIATNVPAKALGFVVRLASGIVFRKEVKDLAQAAVDEVCMATNVQWQKEEMQIAAFGDELQNKLQQALTAESKMLQNAMMLIFAPAELIPAVGHTLKTMLESIAKWGAKYIQKRLKKWIVSFLDSLLLYLSKRANSNSVVEDMIKVFRCNLDPFDFESWEKQKFDALFKDD